jgi:hypothetical protein
LAGSEGDEMRDGKPRVERPDEGGVASKLITDASNGRALFF